MRRTSPYYLAVEQRVVTVHERSAVDKMNLMSIPGAVEDDLKRPFEKTI